MASKMKEIVKGFAEYTSLHGLGRINDSKFIVQRVFWTLATLVSFAMCVVQVYRLGVQFVSGQVTTQLELSNYPQTFPKVKICNMNPFKYSEISKNERLLDVLHATSQVLNVNLSDFDTLVHPEPTKEPESELKQNIHDIYSAKNIFSLEVAKLNSSERKGMAYTFQEMILSCRFNANPCKESLFTLENDPKNGNCYTFATQTKSKVSGMNQGLEMIINVNQKEYIPFMTDNVGVYISIYEEKEKDNDQIPVGFETNIALNTVIYNRLPGKKMACEQSSEYDSVSQCVSQCLSKMILKECFCAMDFRTMLRERDAETNAIKYSLCTSTEDRECVQESLENDVESKCSFCKPPCKEKVYEQLISMTSWPSSSFEPVLKRLLTKQHLAHVNETNIKRHLLLLRVFYSSLTVETIHEEEAYTEENYISDIGGQLGLWIGMSVLSLAEILELGALLIAAVCKREDRNKRKDSNVAFTYDKE